MKLTIYSTLLVLFLFSCTNSGNQDQITDEENLDTLKWATDLAHNYIITDGHVDLPYALTEEGFLKNQEGLANRVGQSEEGNFDFERAKKGGLDAPFMSIYTASSLQLTGGSKKTADSLIDLVNAIIEIAPDKYAPGNNTAQIEENFKKGLISLPMGMENGAPIENDLENIQYFYNRGIRYITLTHALDNQICDSSYDTTRTWSGLSPFGRDVVQKMNEVGIMIDISHVSDSTFYQVLEISTKPVIASHSSCRHFTPGWERNMSDELIQALGEKDGIIMINFGTDFLDGKKSALNNSNQQKLQQMLEEAGEATEEEKEAIRQKFLQENPYQYSDIGEVADHIDHVVKLAGIDHVGFGSDFDGVGDSLPEGLKDVSMFPNLIVELLRRGYSEEDIEKICYANLWRVWKVNGG